MNKFINIILNGNELTLLPQKAIYFKEHNSLIVADMHLGKTSHFRNAGIPVPHQLAFVDLNNLSKIISNPSLDVSKLVIVGDMFHAELNSEWRAFEEWRGVNNGIDIQLIKGNHDRFPNHVYESLSIEVCEYAVLGNLILVHDFKSKIPEEGFYKICGHIHPAVRLAGKGKQSVTLPCFYFGRDFGILPAFGDFTGRYIVTPGEFDFVFAIVKYNDEDRIVKL